MLSGIFHGMSAGSLLVSAADPHMTTAQNSDLKIRSPHTALHPQCLQNRVLTELFA